MFPLYKLKYLSIITPCDYKLLRWPQVAKAILKTRLPTRSQMTGKSIDRCKINLRQANGLGICISRYQDSIGDNN